MIVPSIVCTALLLTFNGLVDGKDFCEVFREYGNKIDYLYVKNRQADSKTIYFVANGMVWPMSYANDPEVAVKFERNNGQEASLMANKYFGAASLCITNNATRETLCQTLLFPKGSQPNEPIEIGSVDVITAPEDDDTKSIAELKFNRTATVTGFPSAAYQFVYGANRKDWENPILDFSINTAEGFTQMRFRFESDGDNFKAIDATKSIPSDVVPTKHNKEVLGVQSQYGPTKRNGTFGFLVIVKEELQIKWCFHTWQESNCPEDDYKLLTDCTPGATDPPSADGGPGGGPNGSDANKSSASSLSSLVWLIASNVLALISHSHQLIDLFL